MSKIIPWIIVAAALAFAVWRRTRQRGQAHGVRRPVFQHLASATRLDQWPLMQSDTALIAMREIRQRVRGRLFRGASVVMVVGVVAAIVIPAQIKGGHSVSSVGVVGTLSAQERAAIVSAGSTVGTTVTVVTEGSADAARADLAAGTIRLALIDADTLVTKKAVTTSESSRTARLARAVAVVLGEQRAFADAGLSDVQAAKVAGAQPLSVTSLEPAKNNGATRAVAIVGVILLFVLLSQYNGWTLTGVMEEKASRVVEVLLATVRPRQLLAGKLLGIGLLVFAQAGVVVVCALAAAVAVGSDVLHGAGPAMIGNILLWLVLGYAFYSWLYAAAGSLAERQEQAQALVLPIALPMIVAYIAAISIASNGSSSTFFDVLAYLPPTAPFIMPVLVGIGAVTWWEVTISAVISIVCTIGVARAAAGIYRRAVLRTGRRVHLRDVLARSSA